MLQNLPIVERFPHGEIDEVLKEHLKALHPWSPTRLTVSNPVVDPFLLPGSRIRLVVVDTPICLQPGIPQLVAFLVLPNGLQDDWLYTTNEGLRRVLSNYDGLARLIVLSNAETHSSAYSRPTVDEDHIMRFQRRVKNSVLIEICLQQNPRFITHQSEIAYASLLVTTDDHVIVQDVAIDNENKDGYYHYRRMRYAETPTLYQADCKLTLTRAGVEVDLQGAINDQEMGGIQSVVMIDHLTQSYMKAMVYGLRLLANQAVVTRPEILSLGLGAGIFERFLIRKFNTTVLGVERKPEEIMDVVKIAFGMENTDGLKVIVGYSAEDVVAYLVDGIVPPNRVGIADICSEYRNRKFNFVTVDIVDGDRRVGVGACLCAPPRAISCFDMYEKVKRLINEGGALILRVVVPDFGYEEDMFSALKTLFRNVYKFGFGKRYEFVVVATDISVDMSSSGALTDMLGEEFTIETA